MADPICRWRNSSIKQLYEFNLLFPFHIMDKKEGRSIVERNWELLGGKDFFITPYQLAAQMGVYYEDNLLMYPRFNKLMDLDTCNKYLQYWGRKYYAPNPYAKSMRQDQKPVVINNFLVNWVLENGEGLDFSDALSSMFLDTIGNTDILINMINSFMDVKVENNKVFLKKTVHEKFPDKDVYLEVNPNDKKAFFDFVGEFKVALSDRWLLSRDKPLQQIYYGAPGTGKSFEINLLTKDKEVIRTTFHPDSDYSTFVGAYKPTSIEIPVRDVTGKVIVENGKQVTENRIVYEFVEQAFLQAYTKAWKAYAETAAGEYAKEQFLVIEEINRGNCAQIFGDLFQLLDRNRYGFSDYPITADKDMKKQLSKAFKDLTIADADRINKIYDKDIISQVLNGEVLLLPDNLYIWATMNTSDQSLFPIDSAFKRRWDWKYMPICEGKENGVSLNWKIKIKTNTYDWWQFVEKINAEINEQTKSEDKKLGYFFCKADSGVITAETFVSKVVFYLWNDVFKDQSLASDIFQDGEEELTFAKFYDVDANGKAVVREDKVELFLQNLGVEIVTSNKEDGLIEIDELDEKNVPDNTRNTLKAIEFPDGTIIESTSGAFDAYIRAIEKIGVEKVASVSDRLKYRRLGRPLISKENYDEFEGTGYSYIMKGDYYFLKGAKTYTYVRILEDLNELLQLGITIRN